MVYIEYDKIVVGTKSPQYKIPPKYKTWSICVITVMVYIEYGRVVVGTKSPHDKKKTFVTEEDFVLCIFSPLLLTFYCGNDYIFEDFVLGGFCPGRILSSTYAL